MTESVYKVITVIGSSPDSWEKAAANAVAMVSKTLRDVRIAEVEKLDMKMDQNKIVAYRARVQLSFRVEKGEEELFHKEPHSWFLEKEHTSMDG